MIWWVVTFHEYESKSPPEPIVISVGDSKKIWVPLKIHNMSEKEY